MGALVSHPAALFAAHPELLAPVLRIVHRVIATFLTDVPSARVEPC